jgi:hypothetical protein
VAINTAETQDDLAREYKRQSQHVQPQESQEQLAQEFEQQENVAHLPPVYRAYEQARSKGASALGAVAAANQEAERQAQAHDALTKRIQEFKKNPNVATGRAITDLVGVIAPAALRKQGANSIATHVFVPGRGVVPVEAASH